MQSACSVLPEIESQPAATGAMDRINRARLEPLSETANDRLVLVPVPAGQDRFEFRSTRLDRRCDLRRRTMKPETAGDVLGSDGDLALFALFALFATTIET